MWEEALPDLKLTPRASAKPSKFMDFDDSQIKLGEKYHTQGGRPSMLALTKLSAYDVIVYTLVHVLKSKGVSWRTSISPILLLACLLFIIAGNKFKYKPEAHYRDETVSSACKG